MKTEWIRVSDLLPMPENERILVSDGETITIARFVFSQNHVNWFFEDDKMKDLHIDYWAKLPPLPPKIVQQEADTQSVVFES